MEKLRRSIRRKINQTAAEQSSLRKRVDFGAHERNMRQLFHNKAGSDAVMPIQFQFDTRREFFLSHLREPTFQVAVENRAEGAFFLFDPLETRQFYGPSNIPYMEPITVKFTVWKITETTSKHKPHRDISRKALCCVQDP